MGKNQRDEIDSVEAARLLGCNVETLRRWARARLAGKATRIDYARISSMGFYFFDRDEIEALLESPHPRAADIRARAIRDAKRAR